MRQTYDKEEYLQALNSSPTIIAFLWEFRRSCFRVNQFADISNVCAGWPEDPHRNRAIYLNCPS
jgi:hypothetical protein